MSETKPRVGQASPSKASPKDEPEAAKPEEDIPAGHCAVYVAIPEMVGTGDSKRPFAGPCEKLVVSDKNANELELRELAFRSEDEARAKYAMWERKKKADEQAALEAAARRAGLRLLPQGTERIPT